TGECADRFRESDTPVSEPQGFQCKFSYLREFAAQTHMKGSLRPLEASRVSLLHFPEVFTYEPICRIDPSLNLELDHAGTHLFEREHPGVGMPSRSLARVARRPRAYLFLADNICPRLFDAPLPLTFLAGRQGPVDKLAEHIVVVVVPQVGSQ